MRLILSRKGFDSQYGKIPSPILPDGQLLALPIPSPRDSVTMAQVETGKVRLGPILRDLSGGNHSLASTVHRDPDLSRRRGDKPRGWRPALGQTGAAQGHLRERGVGAGDVFLFFGWFRRAARVGDAWSYVRGAPDEHVLFGWLEVSAVLPIVTRRADCLRRFPWIAAHPHVANPLQYDSQANTLYVAAARSRYAARAMAGGGRFRVDHPDLHLTLPGAKRSTWLLPPWLWPGARRTPLSYHPRLSSWSKVRDGVVLQSAAKGQEFVLDCGQYPGAEEWVAGLVGGHGST